MIGNGLLEAIFQGITRTTTGVLGNAEYAGRMTSGIIEHNRSLTNMTPDLTVVMATYRQAKWLPQAIESIVHQLNDLRLISVSVHGDKKTSNLVLDFLKYNPKYGGLFTREANLWKQRQTGLEFAYTPYLSFFDSDDVMLPGWLKKGMSVAKEIESRGKIPIVGPSYRMVDEKLKPIGSPGPLMHIPKHGDWPEMQLDRIGKDYVVVPSSLVRYPSDVILPEFTMDRMMNGSIIPDFSITTTEALRSVGGYFDPDGYEIKHPYLSYGMWLRLLKKYGNQVEVKLLPDIGFLYRQHRRSMHNRFNSKRHSAENVRKAREVALHYFPERVT
jgi:glycosyltransferase involved in cell wall biosynthesis